MHQLEMTAFEDEYILSRMDINSPFQLGSVTFPHRLIQGPLAGFSCAPFRAMYALFQQPAYCVSEMISAHDLLYRQPARFVSRAPEEGQLCYQLSGDDPVILAQAARYLASIGADVIDLNCGCPKPKIRKKGAGSALLTQPERLIRIIHAVKSELSIPLTVKIRIQDNEQDILLAQAIADAGADGLIVHGRRWQDDYDVACNIEQISSIKKQVTIPVIANGDIHDAQSLHRLAAASGCDAYMISRAGTGRPWLYQELLNPETLDSAALNFEHCMGYFMKHLEGLSELQDDYQAVLQSKTLARYYFKSWFKPQQLQDYYQLNTLLDIERYLSDMVAMHALTEPRPSGSGAVE